MSRQPRAVNDGWAAEAIYTERGPGMIRREPAAHRAGRLDGAMEGRKEGRTGRRRGGQCCCGSLAPGCFHGRIVQESVAGARRGETLIKTEQAEASAEVHMVLKAAGWTD